MILTNVPSLSLRAERAARETLLESVKKEVKQLMELAASRKVLHEENSRLTSLCASVEACLLHGLESCGFLKANTTLNLVARLASRQCAEAERVLKLCEEYARLYCEPKSDAYRKRTSSLKGKGLLHLFDTFLMIIKGKSPCVLLILSIFI